MTAPCSFPDHDLPGRRTGPINATSPCECAFHTGCAGHCGRMLMFAGGTKRFQALQQALTMASQVSKTLMARQFARRYCQTFSTGFGACPEGVARNDEGGCAMPACTSWNQTSTGLPRATCGIAAAPVASKFF